MKMSQMFIPTLREDPAEAEVVSHKLMLRAGLMRKLASGIYAYLPLGYRTFRKIEQIIREEMDRIGAQELMMSSLLPAENYQASGRWGVFGPEMFKLKDRNKRDFCLGPTHEEVFTEIVKNETRSYRSLPMTLYQIQTKFRDERRPRFGVMRCREFVMKDAYSFDRDDKGLDLSYRRMSEAYRRAFDRCGLDYIVVEADSGAMGGAGSQEFMVKSDVGEAVIAFCTSCGYAANDEKARCVPASYNPEKVANTANSANNTCTDDNTNTVNITNITNTADNTDNANNVKTDKASIKPLSKVATPDARTIEELVRFFDCTSISFAKTMIYKADEKYVVAVVRGDREINETKLKNYLVCSDLELADAEAVRAITGAEVGFAGLVGLKMTQSGISSHGSVIIDEEVALMENFITGANETGYHLANVNIERDFPAFVKADIRNIAAGDPCPVCGQLINISRGIEVGHVFKLGTKYSKALECVYLDESGKENPMVMGSYGIGVGRTMAAVIEQNCDENGIIWPPSVAPFQVMIVIVNTTDETQNKIAAELYDNLLSAGLEVIMDDRNERPGVKFKDADLMGIPVRINVGRKAGEGIVEIKSRRTGAIIEAIVPAAMSEVGRMLGK